VTNSAIGDAGLAALAPALRRLPSLEYLHLLENPLGDEGLARRRPRGAAADREPAAAPPPTTGGLKKLKMLTLSYTSSPTPAAPPSPLRSTSARCRRSRISSWVA